MCRGMCRLSFICFIPARAQPPTKQLHSITGPGSEMLTFAYNGNLLTSAAWSGTTAGEVGASGTTW
jgi:hypothetical protein